MNIYEEGYLFKTRVFCDGREICEEYVKDFFTVSVSLSYALLLYKKHLRGSGIELNYGVNPGERENGEHDLFNDYGTRIGYRFFGRIETEEYDNKGNAILEARNIDIEVTVLKVTFPDFRGEY